MLFSVILAAFVVAQAPPPPTSTSTSTSISTAEQPRLLVLDLEANNLAANDARAVDALVLDSARIDGVALVSQQELRKLAEIEAGRQAADCSSSTCLAEIAGAMGARYVLFGSTSRLGDNVIVSLAIFDADTARTTRETVSVDSIGALPRAVPPKVKALVQAATGIGAASNEPSPVFVGGIVTTAIGAGAVVVGGVGAGIAAVVLYNPDAAGGAKHTAQFWGQPAVYVVGAGVVVAAVGGILLLVGGGE